MFLRNHQYNFSFFINYFQVQRKYTSFLPHFWQLNDISPAMRLSLLWQRKEINLVLAQPYAILPGLKHKTAKQRFSFNKQLFFPILSKAFFKLATMRTLLKKVALKKKTFSVRRYYHLYKFKKKKSLKQNLKKSYSDIKD